MKIDPDTTRHGLFGLWQNYKSTAPVVPCRRLAVDYSIKSIKWWLNITTQNVYRQQNHKETRSRAKESVIVAFVDFGAYNIDSKTNIEASVYLMV